MDKTYWAMVEGMTPPNATMVHYLEKDNRSNNVSAYKKPRGKAKESKLSFETIKQNSNYSLVEIDLFTGRPHQIRVQMAKEGHPLWGDYRYGEEGTKDGKDIGLRAVRLSIEHPMLNKKMTFEAPVPNLQPWNFFEY